MAIQKSKGDYTEYETWLEKEFHVFSQPGNLKEFLEKRKEVFKYSKLTEDGTKLPAATGKDVGGQKIAQHYFLGGREDTPLRGTKASELWEDLMGKEELRFDLLDKTIREAQKELKIPQISYEELSSDELQDIADDLTERVKKHREETKEKETLIDQLYKDRYAEIQKIDNLTEAKNYLKTATSDLGVLTNTERQTLNNRFKERLKAIQLLEAERKLLTLQQGRVMTNIEKTIIRRNRAAELLQNMPYEKRQKLTVSRLRALDITPQEIKTIKELGEYPTTLPR